MWEGEKDEYIEHRGWGAVEPSDTKQHAFGKITHVWQNP